MPPLLLLACRSPSPGDTALERVTFPTPWEDASPSEETVSGSFGVLLGGALPGGGWFAAGGDEGHDAATADVMEVEGATWPVVRVRILGIAEATSLEIDVALNRWVAGDVSLDGEAAVGILTRDTQVVGYLVGGAMQVSNAGVEAGQRVAGSFTDIPLRVSP